jgi:hypothetical protein
MMKRGFEIALLTGLFLVLPSAAAYADGFALLESYPAAGQTVTASDLFDHPICLKFNHPVDRSYIQRLRLLDKSGNFFCQLNVCGFVTYEENDTKVIWHPQTPGRLFQPGAFFEIHIGIQDPPFGPYLFRDTSGNTVPVTYIDFGVDKCQPLGSVKVTDNGVRTILCNSGGIPPFYVGGSGYAVRVTAEISNPSCGIDLTVEGKLWLQLPDGSSRSVVDPFTTVPLSPGKTVSVDLLNHAFVGTEPVGGYELGFRLLNPVNGDTYSTATTGFSFGACPW